MSEATVRQLARARIPTEHGTFELCHYGTDQHGKEHLALVMGEVQGQRDVLVRVHSECFTGDVLGSLRCDCGPQLQRALELVSREASGVIIYLRQEGRGIGLLDKLRAYNLQDQGYDTVDANLILGHQADGREYGIAAEILADLGVASVRLLTNNPSKIESLRRCGVEISARVPLQAGANEENAAYLQTKAQRMRHLLDLELLPATDGETDLPKSAAVPAHQATPSTSRPFVTLSYAQSLDGSITARQGEPLALSGPESMEMTHRLRTEHDAILVGIGTVLADDPRLTVRLVKGPNPQPIVLDSRLRFPAGARLAHNKRLPWIATTQAAPIRQQDALEALGIQVLRLPADDEGRVDLQALLQLLAAKGIGSLMVEGGAAVIAGFLAAGLVDRLVVTIAPRLVGGLHAVPSSAGMNGLPLPRLRHPRFQQLGNDIVLLGELSH